MSQGLVTASYIVAAVLFILSLAGLSKQETAKHGNLFGIAGMAIALLATVVNPETSGVHWIILAMVIGGALGVLVGFGLGNLVSVFAKSPPWRVPSLLHAWKRSRSSSTVTWRLPRPRS